MDLILLLIFPFILWAFTLVLLSNWKYFLKFLILNIFLVIVYFCIIIYKGNYIFGHDEYGLKVFISLFICIITHILIGFIFAVYQNYKLRKNDRTT